MSIQEPRKQTEKEAEVANIPNSFELIEYSSFVVHSEATILSKSTYFSLAGTKIATIQEQYSSTVRKLYAWFSSFISTGATSRSFILYNSNEEAILYIKRKYGLYAVFELYDTNGTYIGKFKSMRKVGGEEWRTFSADGEETGRIVKKVQQVHKDLKITWSGTWSDGSMMEISFIDISHEVIRGFIVGDPIVDVSSVKERTAVHYIIPALIFIENLNLRSRY
ncbi:hypothetical protein ACFDTO_25400 [Microbacteriaceae bacterium 4G12]